MDLALSSPEQKSMQFGYSTNLRQFDDAGRSFVLVDLSQMLTTIISYDVSQDNMAATRNPSMS